MTAPLAVGAHAPYSAVPDRVRAWDDETLGSPVVSVAEQQGEMSPGCASRVVAANGTRGRHPDLVDDAALRLLRRTESARFLSAARRRLDPRI